jgi:hypothetical protein
MSLDNGGGQISSAGPVVSEGPVPANYGIGNGDIPW